MASSATHDEICLISKGLYRIVNDIIGPECIVKLRRQERDIGDALINCKRYECDHMSNGSTMEGFNFKSSDIDIMFIDRTVIGLTGSTLIAAPYNDMPTILLIETENVTPGFAFVRCLRYDQNNGTLTNALVHRGTVVYVSGKQIRESFMSSSSTHCHGPCQSNSHFGRDADFTFTLRFSVWPKQAFPFVKRSFNCGWPSYEILTQIFNDGCLLVPVNSRQQRFRDMVDLQWRISFSFAEKKLVLSMNHTQFLCYGLLKLFLYEIMKKVYLVEDLLCSYFMKTAIFWEISENPGYWSPLNFLSKFWNCFRRLIQWVNVGYCPNFFIPENNMFHGKIFGGKQRILLRTLRYLYKDGYRSLLCCPSLLENFSCLIAQPEISYTFDEQEFLPLFAIEKARLKASFGFDIYINVRDKEGIIKTLINTLAMMNTESTEMICAVRLSVNHVLQAYAQNLCRVQESTNSTNSLNRMKYKDYKPAKSILWRAKTFFCMNDLIFIKHLYITGAYYRTIDMIHYIRRKLLSQQYMYRWNLDGHVIMTALQQGMSYDTIVRSFILSEVTIDKDTASDEIIYECLAHSEKSGGTDELFIPPLAFLYFLLFLSYTRIGETHRGYEVVDELYTILHRDDDNQFPFMTKAISWEILGICQHLCGNRHGAYVSYLKALNDKYNYFIKATLIRIRGLKN